MPGAAFLVMRRTGIVAWSAEERGRGCHACELPPFSQGSQGGPWVLQDLHSAQ